MTHIFSNFRKRKREVEAGSVADVKRNGLANETGVFGAV